MRKYSAKELTSYAKKIGFNKPNVWYSKMDGWRLESDMIEEYLGADSVGARKKLTSLCEGVYTKKETESNMHPIFLEDLKPFGIR